MERYQYGGLKQALIIPAFLQSLYRDRITKAEDYMMIEQGTTKILILPLNEPKVFCYQCPSNA
jgi:hypothetical protein